MIALSNIAILHSIAYITVILIVGLTLSQTAFAIVYARMLFAGRRTSTRTVQNWPKAAVVLSLRGSDPYLMQCMLAVLDQDYEDFKLFIIVDSPDDAAWPDVRRLESGSPDRVVCKALSNRLTTCSLKCCALAEVVESLDPTYEVVVFLDGDAAPHRQWLRELVQPLANNAIGATTGNRWYTPEKISWGSMVRYFWNAGAVVQVWLNGITWAGSMAMRRETIDEIGLISAWRKSLSVDGTVVRQMRSKGLKTEFVPSVILPNREDISIAQFIPWSERQLIAAKSSESGWFLVLLHAFTIAICVFAPIAMVVAGMAGDTVLLRCGCVAFLVYWILSMASCVFIELAMQRIIRSNGVATQWINWKSILYFFPAMVLSHLVYFRTLIGANFRKRVHWRGVEYEIAGTNDVRMVRYSPYQTKMEIQDAHSVV